MNLSQKPAGPYTVTSSRDPRAELAAHSIVKSARGLAVAVVLKVSRVEVIGEIEDFQPQLQTIIS